MKRIVATLAMSAVTLAGCTGGSNVGKTYTSGEFMASYLNRLSDSERTLLIDEEGWSQLTGNFIVEWVALAPPDATISRSDVAIGEPSTIVSYKDTIFKIKPVHQEPPGSSVSYREFEEMFADPNKRFVTKKTDAYSGLIKWSFTTSWLEFDRATETSKHTINSLVVPEVNCNCYFELELSRTAKSPSRYEEFIVPELSLLESFTLR